MYTIIIFWGQWQLNHNMHGTARDIISHWSIALIYRYPVFVSLPTFKQSQHHFLWNPSTSCREISAKLGQAQSRAFKVPKSLWPPERSEVHNIKPWHDTGRSQDGVKKLHWCPKHKLTTTLDAWRSKIVTSRVSSRREPYLDHYELTLWWVLKSPFVTCDN